jgi:riboflavin kinase/FMN adenylyltransferase
MKILHAISELGALRQPVWLAIGVFDGVHQGHRAVMRAALDGAAAGGGVAVAMTFDPHPARIMRPEFAPKLLTSTAHKARLIEAVGLPYLLVVHFDEGFSAQPPEEFVREIAGACGALRQICVGEDWVFGAKRAGNVALLDKLGAELGFTVNAVKSVKAASQVVSSTRIREAVASGALDLANELLGRAYTILGSVEPGDQLGRTIGFPTANLRAHAEQFPPNGVYAVRVALDGETRNGVANIGYRPTVAEGVERKLEVHLFDFAGDLYGRDLEVEFVKFLRPEQKFAGVEELQAQISRDAALAREVLA